MKRRTADDAHTVFGGKQAAEGEAADSTATTTDKKTDVVKGVLNLFKKKN